MVKISKGYSFQPYTQFTLRAEIRNVVLTRLGLSPVDIRKLILKQGISNMVGAKATLKPKRGAPPLPEHLMAELLKLTESSEALEILLREGSSKDLDSTRKSDIETMERIRQNLWKVKDNNLRYRVFMAINITDMILPELGKITIEWKLPPDLIIKKNLTRKDVEALLVELPTALCLFTLIYYRDQQISRPIQANDFNDIWFLTLAIPYSDIVVTERMWTSIAIGSKLDKKCKTKVFSSVYNLCQYL